MRITVIIVVVIIVVVVAWLAASLTGVELVPPTVQPPPHGV